MDKPRHIVVLHNTDYDDELTGGSPTDVSAVLISARAIAAGLVQAGYDAVCLGIAGPDIFDVITHLRALGPGLLVFNLCESMCGDSVHEPTLPGMLDLFAIPYTGSDPLALGSCLHKDRCKDILRGAGVSTPPAMLLRDESAFADARLATLDYPWFLKLVHEDASVGIEADCVVNSREALFERARYMFREWKQPVLAERYIAGREVNVTLLGETLRPDVLPLHEIDFAKMPVGRPHIVSYAGKWDEEHVDYAGTKPVPLRDADPGLHSAIVEVAQAAWRALGLRDYGRVDLRIDSAGKPFVIDINPNCDISPDAGVARAAASAGISYPQLVERIALSAWARAHRRGRS